MLEHAIDRVRSDPDQGLDSDKLAHVPDNFLGRVDNKFPVYNNLKNDLEDIAKKSQNKNSSGKWMAAHQVPTKAISENGNSSDADKKSKAQQLQRTLGTITQKYKGGTEGTKNDV